MTSPIQFSAQPDQLRRLKHGSNPELLRTWANRAFQGWEWNQDRQAVLDRLAAHPWLPKSGLREAQWPSSALRDPHAVRAALAAGFRFENVSMPQKATTPRAAALEENAPPHVHEMMDAAGVAGANPSEIERWFTRSLKLQHHHTFRVLMTGHWGVCRLAFDPPEESPLLKFVLTDFARAHYTARTSYNEFNRRFLDLAIRDLFVRGIDCLEAIDIHLGGPGEDQARIEIRNIYAQARAEHMDNELPPARQGDGGASPGMRRRF